MSLPINTQYAVSTYQHINYPAAKQKSAFIDTLKGTSAANVSQNSGTTLESMLQLKFPGLKYHVADTSRINSALWRTRNDFPHEAFFADTLDESVFDWQPTSKAPSQLDSSVQSRLTARSGKFAVVIPPALQEKLDNNPALQQEIMDRVERLMAWDSYCPMTNKNVVIDSCVIVFNEDGEIIERSSSSSGGIIMPSEDEQRQLAERKKAKAKREEEYQRLLQEASLNRKKMSQEISQRHYQKVAAEEVIFMQMKLSDTLAQLITGSGVPKL